MTVFHAYLFGRSETILSREEIDAPDAAGAIRAARDMLIDRPLAAVELWNRDCFVARLDRAPAEATMAPAGPDAVAASGPALEVVDGGGLRDALKLDRFRF